MKRILCLIAVLTLLFAVGVSASSASQNITLVEDDGVFTFITEKASTVWEAPSLRAGEARTSAGVLNITNETDRTQTVRLSTVVFPYDDTEVLEYLNHLHITIKSGDTVLYNGLYSEINSANDPVIEQEIQAMNTAKFTIDMYCDYTYAGMQFAKDHLLEWQFTNQALAEELQIEEEADPLAFLADTLVIQWLIAAILTVIAVWLLRRRVY